MIFFLSKSNVMLTSDIVPNDAIHYTDGATGKVVWRNALRLEALENQTSVESLAARQAVIVTSDEAFQTDKEGNRVKNPEEEQTNEDTAASSTCPRPIRRPSGSKHSPCPFAIPTVQPMEKI